MFLLKQSPQSSHLVKAVNRSKGFLNESTQILCWWFKQMTKIKNDKKPQKTSQPRR